MTTIQTRSPSSARFARDLGEVRKEVLARVEAILPALADAAADAEAERDLTPESFAALVESGALRLFAPQRAGGYEAGYRTYVESTVLLARACGSSAWLSFILNHGDWQTGQMSAAVQERVWAGNSASAKVAVPLAPMPGWRAERHDGGTTVSGDWPYSSGSSHASWALIGFPLLDDDGSQTDNMIGLINTSGIPVRDTWHVAGMAGTGSNTFEIRDVFIPDEETITLSAIMSHRFETPHTAEAQYHMDSGVIFHVATLVPVVSLAKAALDLTLERITTRPKPVTYTFYADTTKSAATQFAMARATWLIETALEQTRATADAIDAQALTARPFPAIDRARFAMRSAQAHRMCREGVDLLLDVQGAGAFALNNPLQRIWRDMHVASRHGLSVPGMKQELYGRALLGADEQQMTPIR